MLQPRPKVEAATGGKLPNWLIGCVGRIESEDKDAGCFDAFCRYIAEPAR